MTRTSASRTVYIVDGDPDLSLSTQVLLETRDCLVKMVSGADDFLKKTVFNDTDVVLLDLDQNKPSVFRTLNHLMFSSASPVVIVKTDHGSALRPGDIFPSHRIKVLVHPVAPMDLIAAVETSELPAF